VSGPRVRGGVRAAAPLVRGVSPVISPTGELAAPPRVGEAGRGAVFKRVGGPGGDLLFRALRRSTIGAEGFHGRVRDGIGCFAPRYGHQAVPSRIQRSQIGDRNRCGSVRSYEPCRFPQEASCACVFPRRGLPPSFVFSDLRHLISDNGPCRWARRSSASSD
jgi:hypothetical protein